MNHTRLIAVILGLSAVCVAGAMAFVRCVERIEPASGPLELVASGLTKPVDFVCDPNNPSRFYIVEQVGAIRVIENGELIDEPFFEVDSSDFTDRGWEQGLLGMALDPGYADNGRFYVNFTGKDGSTRIMRYTAQSPRHADAATGELILRIAQPYANHNGGCVRFGPDGMLYIGTGDGGLANDPGGRAQDLSSLLGKMLRIDVTSEPPGGQAYGIPRDNPFLSRAGARAEIWALGLRNPWKFCFDSTGRLWIADVGQNAYEEVDVQRAGSHGGENYGWNYQEGPEDFEQRVHPKGGVPGGLTAPVFWYKHHPTASISGGYLYEGETIDSLDGLYLCADFMSGRMWTVAVDERGTAGTGTEVTDRYRAGFGGKGMDLAISGFGRDNDGELYILDHKAGRVLKIVN